MWDPKYSGEILTFNNSRDAFGVAQYLLGYDVNSTNPDEWRAAEEKLKEQKRQEKQKRKDERKSGGTSSFEDMIAYVDENGILHTTPQDVKPKTEIDVSQIEISTPKQEEMEILPSTGRVEYFTASKGYGFIKDADSGEKYFFHISSAPDTIAEGDKVTFEIERGTRGLAAVRISIINKQ
jgi:cold shock CspA family protein